jgi:hypothetical protein
MKVEHITLLGSSLVRDTQDIALFTVNFFKDFQISKTVRILDIPKTPLKVKVTSSQDMAIFDIMRGDSLLFTNFCCFDESQKDEVFNMVLDLAKMLPMYKNTVIRKPNLPQFLFTVPVPTIFASFDEIQLCGEIELYIYYSLYLAYRQTI